MYRATQRDYATGADVTEKRGPSGDAGPYYDLTKYIALHPKVCYNKIKKAVEL